ncbi:hypothetical protein FQT01_12515 [Enterococcus faecalis]|nr:hypothetical protein [Enterococcus faecalis]
MPEFDSLGARQEPPEEKEVLEPTWEYDEEEDDYANTL